MGEHFTLNLKKKQQKATQQNKQNKQKNLIPVSSVNDMEEKNFSGNIRGCSVLWNL